MVDKAPKTSELEADKSETNQSLTQQVGARLKLLREKHGLSQRELARRANIANGALSSIEQGKVSPSISSLEKVLNAFPVSLPEFFADDIESAQSVYSRDDFVHIHKNDTEYQILPLVDSAKEGAYMARLRYAPGAKITSEWMVHNGFIAGIVIEGSLQLLLEGIEYSLSAGEGFYFSHHRHHAFTNVSGADCIVVIVSFSE